MDPYKNLVINKKTDRSLGDWRGNFFYFFVAYFMEPRPQTLGRYTPLWWWNNEYK